MFRYFIDHWGLELCCCILHENRVFWLEPKYSLISLNALNVHVLCYMSVFQDAQGQRWNISTFILSAARHCNQEFDFSKAAHLTTEHTLDHVLGHKMNQIYSIMSLFFILIWFYYSCHCGSCNEQQRVYVCEKRSRFLFSITMSQILRLEQGSTPVVGSSKTTKREPPMKAMEIDSFRFMPPDRVPTSLCLWEYMPVSSRMLKWESVKSSER